MMTLISLVALIAISYVGFKLLKRSKLGSTVKQAGRIIVNETKSILNQLEDFDKSLTNALYQSKEQYTKYKDNCGSIFSLEVKLTKELIEHENTKKQVDEKLKSLKSQYQQNIENLETKQGIEDAISFYLEKQQNLIQTIDEKTAIINEQKTQNIKVTNNLKRYQQNIETLENKIDYVRTQYTIAKNKEMMNKFDDGSGLYDLNEIFTQVKNYINKVDGDERVVDIVLESDRKEQQISELTNTMNKKEMLNKFLSE